MYSELMTYNDSNFIEHHGILGQKWGVRRFQDKDGHLLKAGLKRRARLAKMNAEYEFSKARLKGSKAAKSFVSDVSRQYNNRKIDTLDYLNRKGVFDLIDSYKSKIPSDIGNTSKQSKASNPYHVDYEKRNSSVFDDVARINSYFNGDTDSRKTSVKNYAMLRTLDNLEESRRVMDGTKRGKLIDDRENDLINGKTKSGPQRVADAKGFAGMMFANNIANMSMDDVSDPSKWDSAYESMGRDYLKAMTTLDYDLYFRYQQ